MIRFGNLSKSLIGILALSLFLPSHAEAVKPKPTRAVQWMGISAEKDALTRLIYQTAETQILKNLAKKDGKGKPPAVVMDVDETVLNNTPFNMKMEAEGKPFNSDDWEDWTEWPDLKPVAGAKEFIDAMERAGVKVIYMTNRTQYNRPQTLKSLKSIGVSSKDFANDRVMLICRTAERSKESRRQDVLKLYDVLGYFGDQLADFTDEFDTGNFKTPVERERAIARQKDKFGTVWFILPNPMYGDWTTYIKD